MPLKIVVKICENMSNWRPIDHNCPPIDSKHYKSSIQHFRLSVALAEKYTWLMTVEETFQKRFSQSICNEFFLYWSVTAHQHILGHFELNNVLNNVLVVHDYPAQ